jgi:hypothetical protein
VLRRDHTTGVSSSRERAGDRESENEKARRGEKKRAGKKEKARTVVERFGP